MTQANGPKRAPWLALVGIVVVLWNNYGYGEIKGAGDAVRSVTSKPAPVATRDEPPAT